MAIELEGNNPAATQMPASAEPYNEAIVSVRGLSTRFGSQTIHEDVSFDLRKGEVLGIVGGSGTGKSVLLREIIGLMDPSGGTISLFGQDMRCLGRKARQQLLRRCGVLFQDGALFSSLTVAENVALPILERGDVPRDLADSIARVKLQIVGLAWDAGDKYPSEISGGMRKRAGLARALALDPDVVFLDEPTAGLDPIGAANFDNLIGELRKAFGLTVMMVTHDVDSLIAVCDRIAVLVDKRILTGTIEELVATGHPWIADYFTGPRGRAAAKGQD